MICTLRTLYHRLSAGDNAERAGDLPVSNDLRLSKSARKTAWGATHLRQWNPVAQACAARCLFADSYVHCMHSLQLNIHFNFAAGSEASRHNIDTHNARCISDEHLSVSVDAQYFVFTTSRRCEKLSPDSYNAICFSHVLPSPWTLRAFSQDVGVSECQFNVAGEKSFKPGMEP